MSLLSSVSQASTPTAAIELAQDRVAGASLEWRGAQAIITSYSIEPLEPGTLTASLTGTNVHDRPALAAVIGRVLGQIGRPRRIALVLPDPVAKVSLLKFEQVPTRPQDLDQLVRWQIRKSAPFAIEDAQVTYTAGHRGPEGQEFLVSLARRETVQEYETLCAESGAHPGVVDLSTFNVINAALAASRLQPLVAAGDWLLVHVADGYVSIAILRGPHLIFFRNRSAGDGAEGTLADLVHQTAMYYVDRLNGTGFARVVLAGAGADAEEARRSIEERLSTTVQSLDLLSVASLTDKISAAPTLLDALAPLVGVLVRDVEVAS